MGGGIQGYGVVRGSGRGKHRSSSLAAAAGSREAQRPLLQTGSCVRRKTGFYRQGAAQRRRSTRAS